jgi:hypothetical protein
MSDEVKVSPEALEKAAEAAEKVVLEGEAAQKAVDKQAESNSMNAFQAAAMTHSRLYFPFVEKLDQISGGAAKRILRYLVGYPFFVPELNPQNKEVEDMAKIADILVEAKYTMALEQSIQKEIKRAEEMAKIEADIMPIPDDIPKAAELTEETLNEAGQQALNKIGEV